MMDRRQAGVTLIELLVVVIIIGVLLGITLLSPSLKGAHQRLTQEAARLEALFAQIRDEAMINNRFYGFSLTESGEYQWWIASYNLKEWQRLNERPFQKYQLPDDMTASLIPLDANTRFDFSDKEPMIVFSYDYQTVPFRLLLSTTNTQQKHTVSLISDGLADIKLETLSSNQTAIDKSLLKQ